MNNNKPAPPPVTPGGRVNHSEQLEELRRVLPDPPNGTELTARAQILEYTMQVIERLMQRATFLAVELAVASPEATRRWVRACSGCGQRPFMHTVGSVMKLFAMRKDWRYAEWWTLDERKIKRPASTNGDAEKQGKRKKRKVKHEPQELNQSKSGNPNRNNNRSNNSNSATTATRDNRISNGNGNANAMKSSGDAPSSHQTNTAPAVMDTPADDTDDDADSSSVDKPAGVMEDPGDVHGCVVRDSESVMRLAWTLIQRNNGPRSMEDVVVLDNDEGPQNGNGNGNGSFDVRGMIEFAKESQQFEFGPRVGMPGRVWTSRRAEWLTNLKDSEVFIRSPLAQQFGMSTCLAVPIQFGGHVHSVMAFFSQHARPYDSDSYDLACTLSRCVEEVYSPTRTAPWITGTDSLFPGGKAL